MLLKKSILAVKTQPEFCILPGAKFVHRCNKERYLTLKLLFSLKDLCLTEVSAEGLTPVIYYKTFAIL